MRMKRSTIVGLKYGFALTVFAFVSAVLIFKALEPSEDSASTSSTASGAASPSVDATILEEDVEPLDFAKVDFWDVDKEAAGSFAASLDLCLFLEEITFRKNGLDCPKALHNWAGLLCTAYAKPECRQSWCDMVSRLETNLPIKIMPGEPNAPAEGTLGRDSSWAFREKWSMCGIPWDKITDDPYTKCLGINGLMCGWWHVLHTTQVALYEMSDALAWGTVQWQEAQATMSDWVITFLPCDSCIVHFIEVAFVEGDEHNIIDRVKSAREMVLYNWWYHNNVNEVVRPAETEEDQLYDPRFPKRPFPYQSLCANCSTSGVHEGATEDTYFDVPWDESNVLTFFLDFYTYNVTGQ